MSETTTRDLRKLERLLRRTGPEAAAAKRALLARLDRSRLPSPRALLRFHECLVYLHAYPDDAALLRRVEAVLRRFSRRRDLRTHREALFNTGIAGTPIDYPFYWSTAVWLAGRWPERLTLDWERFEHAERLDGYAHLLVPFSETPALDQVEAGPREWIERSRGRQETDAAFLIRRVRAMAGDDFVRQTLYEDLDPPIRLAPGPGGPARTGVRYRPSPVIWQTRPPDRSRPDLREAAQEPPRRVRAVPVREGERLIDLAREAMVTRSRDLDTFMYADPRDVRLVDFEDGLQFACIGARPERRLLLEAVYGFLTLKNGVPVGYVLASAFMNSSELAYNVFDPFRGGESARILGKVISMIHHLLGADTFTLDPFQLGYGNREGLESGAWWFYYKMGFRPRDPGVRRLLRKEQERMARNPRHRSTVDTLEQLASENLFLALGSERADVLGRFDLGRVGLAVTRELARRFGSDRERGLRTCSEEAARLLGLRSFRGMSAGQRQAWERWGPLVAVLPGVSRWSPDNRRALAAVIRAKGGRRESTFVSRLDAHAALRRSLVRLSRS